MYNEPIYGKPVILVKAVEDSSGSFPNAFRQTYKCLVCKVLVNGSENRNGENTGYTDYPSNVAYSTKMCEGLSVTIEDGLEDRAIMACNFRRNKIVKNHYYLAFLVDNYYVLDNQAAFLENLT